MLRSGPHVLIWMFLFGFAANVAGGQEPPSTGADSEAVNVFLQELWLDYWGVDYVPGESLMVLEPVGSLPDGGTRYRVDVLEGGMVVAEGEYEELRRVESSSIDLPDDSPLTSVEWYATAGILSGATGRTSGVRGMVQISQDVNGNGRLYLFWPRDLQAVDPATKDGSYPFSLFLCQYPGSGADRDGARLEAEAAYGAPVQVATSGLTIET